MADMLIRTEKTGKQPLYEEVAAKVAGLIEQGTFRPGEKVPSVRQLSAQLQVSINTILEAYALLENMLVIEARPQSGYYVCSRHAEPEPVRERLELVANSVTVGDISVRIMCNIHDASLLPLGAAIPNPDLLPIERLNRMLVSETRRFPIESASYALPPGIERLRKQVAKRCLTAGCTLSHDDIVITSGCVEAVTLALRAVCRPGDTVAIESPSYYNFLQVIRDMGLKVLEIPSSPREGMNIDVLRYAMRTNPISACLIISNFNNPLGSVMPDERKKELVELLAAHDIPLIEDDIYGDLAFGARPSVAKSYDRKGLVMLCSSFTKTVAPGYRVGWIAPGRFKSEVERLKILTNLATPSPTQLAMAGFLANGGYDHHLRAIRKVYAKQVAQFREAVGRHFPAGTRVTRPEGSFVLWVEMPEEVDSLLLYEAALREGISIAPGPIFTAGDKFRNCIRLNAAFWDARIIRAVETLGSLAGDASCRREGRGCS